MAQQANPAMKMGNTDLEAKKATENLVNPLDVTSKSAEDSELIKNIVSAETAEKKSILGEAPILDTSLLQDVLPPTSISLIVLKIFFGLLLAFGLASFLFFTSQLTGAFDFIGDKLEIPNASQELSSKNAEIIRLQTDLNLYRYLEIKALLDKFSFDGDSYMKYFETLNSQTASTNDKDIANQEIKNAKTKLKDSFLTLREKFAAKFLVPLIDTDFSDDLQLNALFEDKLRNALNEKAAEFVNSKNPQAKRDYKNYIQATNLVGNNNLRSLIIQTDFESLSDEELYNLIKTVNSMIVNDLSIIQNIKNKRVKWSDIINEIELRTIAVDNYYNEDFYDALGGIRYTSYDFDSAQRRITITGETKRFDTTNFTMLANLIDELNRSDLFENGEMRSFSKSGSLDEGYTASLKLTLDLQDGQPGQADAAINLEAVPEFSEAPPEMLLP